MYVERQKVSKKNGFKCEKWNEEKMEKFADFWFAVGLKGL